MTMSASMDTATEYPVEPIVQLEGGFTPFDIWLECRGAQRLWQKGFDTGVKDEDRLQSVVHMCQRLSCFPGQRWLALNCALGWVPEAAAAYSWCQDATLPQTMMLFNQLQYLAAAPQNTDFCARLLNPALLPPNLLSGLVEAGGRQLHAISVLIAARPEAPRIDLSYDDLQKFPEHLLSMLDERSGKANTGQQAMPQPHADFASRGEEKLVPSAALPAQSPKTSKTDHPKQLYADGEQETNRQHLINRTIQLRGWTDAMIAEAKTAQPTTVTIAGYAECWRFQHPQTGASIVLDRSRGELLHVGHPNFAYLEHNDLDHGEMNSYDDPNYDKSTRKTAIWVPLKYELVKSWLPVPASHMKHDIYCILPALHEHQNEHLLYPVTAYVRCKPIMFHDGVHLAAVTATSL